MCVHPPHPLCVCVHAPPTVCPPPCTPPPPQVVDYYALVGMSSLGIRGVRGVGPARAAELLAQVPEMDAVYGPTPAPSFAVVEGAKYPDVSFTPPAPPALDHVVSLVHNERLAAHLVDGSAAFHTARVLVRARSDATLEQAELQRLAAALAPGATPEQAAASTEHAATPSTSTSTADYSWGSRAAV